LFRVPSTTRLSTLSLHDALPIYSRRRRSPARLSDRRAARIGASHQEFREERHGASGRALLVAGPGVRPGDVEVRPAVVLRETSRSEEHTSELQSRENLVCRLLLE